MTEVSNIMAHWVDTPDQIAVPTGTYQAKVVGATPKISKNNAQNVGLNPQFEITEGECKGARVFDGLCFLAYDPSADSWQRKRSVAKVKVLFKAVGFVPDFSQFAGQAVTPEHTVKVGEDYIKPNILEKTCTIIVSNRAGDNNINDYQAPQQAAVAPTVAAQ